MRRIAPWLPLGATVLCALPALGSALFLDDWIYLTGAELMLERPAAELHRIELAFLGEVVPAHAATHALGAWAWLVPLVALGGDGASPTLLQIGSLGWFVLLCAAAGHVARTAGGSSAAARWLLLATPPLLLLTHRIMPDLPFTSLGIAALAAAAVAVGSDRAGTRWAAAAALAALLSASWLVAYQALALLAVVAVALPWLPRGRRTPVVLATAFAAALFVAGQVYSALLLGQPHLAIAGEWFSGSIDTSEFTAGFRLWAYLGYLGAFGAPSLLVAATRARVADPALAPTASVAVLAGVACLATGWTAGTGSHGLLVALAVASGAGQLALLATVAVRAAVQRAPIPLMVAGWGLATAVGGWWLLPAPLARYLLPVHVAVAVAAATWPRREADGSPGLVPRAAWVLSTLSLAVWLLLSVGISRSDAARADATERLVQRLPLPAGGGHFVGESGFRIAAETRGMTYVSRYDPIPSATVLHADVGQATEGRLHPTLFSRLGPAVEGTETYAAPVTAVDWDGGADFYFPFTGALPFTFPGDGTVHATSYALTPALTDSADRALSCLAAGRRQGGTWPTSVRWSPDGEWVEVHSVFTTAEVLTALAALPRQPPVVRLAEPALDALEADRNDDGSWSFYGRPDRVGDRPDRAWEITPDADDTARAALALRAWGRPVADETYDLLAGQVEADGTVRTWLAPTEAQVRTDSDTPDPVVAAAVARALEGTSHGALAERIRSYLRGIAAAGVPESTTYYEGRARISREIQLALGESPAEDLDWPIGAQREDGCWPLQPTFFGAPEAGRPAYGSVAEPTAVGATRTSGEAAR